MKQDRFLIIILTAVGLLVITALGLFFIRQSRSEYGPEDTPDGVLRNYVIALHDSDFEKAYGYLQDENHKPDYQEFRQNFFGGRSKLSNVSVKILEIEISEDGAFIQLTLTYGGTSPFQSVWSSNESALLKQQNGDWKLAEMPTPYWGWDWYEEP